VRANEIFVGYRAVVAAVSSEDGFIYYENHQQAINTDSWLEYVRNLSAKMDGASFALYMDQLQVHKTKVAMKLYNELEILPIFNISYMPELNPIESVFSHVKRIFNRTRLWALVNDVPFDMDEQISDAFDVITPELVDKCE
jgi:transposase